MNQESWTPEAWAEILSDLDQELIAEGLIKAPSVPANLPHCRFCGEDLHAAQVPNLWADAWHDSWTCELETGERKRHDPCPDNCGHDRG